MLHCRFNKADNYGSISGYFRQSFKPFNIFASYNSLANQYRGVKEGLIYSTVKLDEEKVGILTNNGNYVTIDTEEINAIGRATAGVRAIKLSDDGTYNLIIGAADMGTLSQNGLIKKSPINEFPVCSRGIKGKKISDVRDGDKIVKFLTLSSDCDIIITTKKKSIKISSAELRTLSRAATGVKSADMAENDSAIDLMRGQD